MARLHVRLNEDTDQDVIAWLDVQADKTAAVKDAIRAAMAGRGASVSVDDVYRAVLDLAAKVQAGPVIVNAATAAGSDAPGTEAAAAALDNLGL